MKPATRLLAFALLLSAAPVLAQASANARWVEEEGCWCGYQTGTPRDYWVRGRGASASEKQATADMLAEWNRHVGLFNVRIDLSNALGTRNGVNEVNTYITSAEANAQYGFTMEPGLFGRAVMFPDEGFGSFNECRDFDPSGCGSFTETDVVINAGFGEGWTADWFAPGNDQRGGLAMVQATVLHEVGHTLGLHHIFQLPGAGASSFSTMNYANDDAARWVTRIDSKTVRTEYPSRAASLLDLAIYPLVYGNDKYAQEYATISKTSVTPGESFALDRWTIQNVGSQAASNIVVTFYAWPRTAGRHYPQTGDLVLGTATWGSADVDGEARVTGTTLSVPSGAAAGEYWVGAIVTANGSEDQAWQAGKPSNNRFVVGHSPRTVLRVLAGGGGGTPLAADFSFTPVSPLAGQPVGFTDSSRGTPTGWSWSFGDPASGGANGSTARNPSHTYATPGTYTVTLSVTGGGSSQIQRSLVVGGKPTTGGSATQTLFVPIVLDVRGAVGSARFGSELTLANRGTTTATARLTYTAASYLGASGSGMVTETLAPGRQLIVPDAIAYLRSKGRPIPSDGTNQGGTLRVTFEGLSSEDAGFASVRTTIASGKGRAGLAYPGLPLSQLLDGDAVLVGLRQNGDDRTNLALANAGTSGTIALRVYVVLGDGSSFAQLEDIQLEPGQWRQVDRILTLPDPDFADGWVLVERVSGTEPYVAYAVFNDNVTNDGSFVPAVPAESVDAFGTVPVLVESTTYRSELVVANLSEEPGYAFLEYTESNAAAGESTGLFYVELASGQQEIFPDILDQMRAEGATIGPRGPTYAGALSVAYASDTSLLVGLSGARTGAPAAGGGQYGLFYTSLGGQDSAVDAWLFGLQENSSLRSNLSLVNAGVFNDPIRVRVEVFDGRSGLKVSETTVGPLGPGQWKQLDRVLGSAESGYVHLTVVEGLDAFFAYATVVDGKDTTSGTNDGSYVPMTVAE